MHVTLYMNAVMMKQLSNECFFAWVESEIENGRSVKFRVKGNSMLPLLRSGVDEVVVCPCRKEDLKPLDVVLFRHAGRHVLHRIIKVEHGRYLMQGDGVWRFHEECGAEVIVGIVKKICRPTGKEVETDSFRWRLESRLWRMLGKTGRRVCLRIMAAFKASVVLSSGPAKQEPKMASGMPVPRV